MSAAAAVQDYLLPGGDGQEGAPQILTFRLGQTVFGIDVRHVREVLDVIPITPMANAPASLVGMVDVRHEGVPVVDLKHKLRLGDTSRDAGSDTRIIVLEIGGGQTPQVLAIIADAVLEVVEHDPASLESPPQIGEAWDAGFIRGIGRRDQEFMTLLDIEAVFRPRDLMFDMS